MPDGDAIASSIRDSGGSFGADPLRETIGLGPATAVERIVHELEELAVTEWTWDAPQEVILASGEALDVYWSGDEDPADGVRGTHDQFFPANHRHRGLMDVIGYQNMRSFGGGLDLQPTSKLRFNLQIDDYRLRD